MTPRHLERIDWSPRGGAPPALDAWPFTVPAVASLVAAGGFDVAPGVTFLVGENGSGKSTLVEAMAAVYPRRGFATPFLRHTGPEASREDSPLAAHLRARTNRRASPAGFFLRAEAMHGYLDSIDDDPRQAIAWGGEKMNQRSHGESFLAVLRHRFLDVGVYFLDEPESALSFRSCLGLLTLLDRMRREGSQIVVATHSPILTALPGATLVELGEHGMATVDSYEALGLVQDHRQFMTARDRYLRHLFDE